MINAAGSVRGARKPGRNVSLRNNSLEWLPIVALSIYFVRDVGGGFFRYYTQIFHVSAVWFIPDILAFACIPYFIYNTIWLNRSAAAAWFVFFLSIYILYGGMFLNSVNATISSIKMIVPVFVGFCFYNRTLGDYPRFLRLLEWLLYISMAGVVASSYVRMPWVGFSFELFGAKKTTSVLWWSAHEERLSGFASDNTVASLLILLTFVITSFRRHYLWSILVGIFNIYIINLTTSKTSLVSIIIYLVCITGCRLLPECLRFLFVRSIALLSFFACFIPLLSIIILSGIDLTDISPKLFSMQDRINNSWQLPFVYMMQLFPPGIFLGCGVGCFNYPQLEFSEYASYWIPEDNFYLGTYTMFGLPFVYFVFKAFLNLRNETDLYKLVIIFIMNIFTVTVLCYVPTTGLVVIALCFSPVFRPKRYGSIAAQRFRPSVPVPDHRLLAATRVFLD